MLTPAQMKIRARVHKMLTEAQGAFYDGKPIDKDKAKGLVRSMGAEKMGCLFKSEVDKLQAWVDGWGHTFDGEPTPISWFFDATMHPSHQGGMTATYRSVVA